MHTDRIMTEFITDPPQFYKRVNGADTEIHDLCLLNHDLVEVVFKCKQEYADESKATNLFIGIFTTAWARLELYNLLYLLGESVLYVDTDNCVYVSKLGVLNLLQEIFLGILLMRLLQNMVKGRILLSFFVEGPRIMPIKLIMERSIVK